VPASAHRKPRSGWRPALAGAAALCLLWPAASLYPDVAWNLHVWSRLRHAGRRAPDTDADIRNRALIPFLPPAGPVCLSMASLVRYSPVTQQQIEQFTQYSLAPRVLRLSSDCEFVIERGPSSAPSSLVHDPAFGLVMANGDDLRLFRRATP
jgi:hypothetical protein